MIHNNYLCLIWITISMSLMQSCHKRCESSLGIESYFQSIDETKKDLGTAKVYYFISMGGCQDCVLESIEFSKTQLNNPNINFILVSQTGNKTMRVHYDKAELNSDNVFLDPKFSDGKGKAKRDDLIGTNITVYYQVRDCFDLNSTNKCNF